MEARASTLEERGYRLIRSLGRGAMAEVFLVQRTADGVQLALKSLVIASARDRTLALNEVSILRSLEHPHIVGFADSFQHEDQLCIAMELCADGDLAGLLQRQRQAQRRLPEVEVRSMMAQLASALAHVHAKKVLHRDLKASNVLVRAAHTGAPLMGGAAGGPAAHAHARHHLLLSDFGVAKALESTKALACTQCGTPYYLPPEVCAAPLTHRVHTSVARAHTRDASGRVGPSACCHHRYATERPTMSRPTCGPSVCSATSSPRCATRSPARRCRS
jgi:NIMA (never in mitosis gene a)-related kinase